MPIEEIPLNLDALKNISQPNITIPNGEDIITQAPIIADRITGGSYATGMLIGLAVMLYWNLSDRTNAGDFRYNDVRAIGIISGILSIIGLVMLSANLIYNLVPVALCVAVFISMNFIYFLITSKEWLENL